MTKRLYRKGDKIAVTFTVEADQSGLFISCSAPSYAGGLLARWPVQFLDGGVLTPAPEPKYVPSVGDIFRYSVVGSERRCLYVDDLRIVSEVLNLSAGQPQSIPLDNRELYTPIFVRKEF